LQSTAATSSAQHLEALIAAARNTVSGSLAEAAETDTVDSFPQKTLAAMSATGLLTACVASAYGGQNLGLLPGTNSALLQILKNAGSGNLVIGRVLEGHMNAQLLLHQFGTEAQQKRFAQDAFGGKLFGVWNTQAQDGTFLTPTADGQYLLNGAKTFATGTDYVSRPLITAALPDGGWQMCIVPLEEVPAQTDDRWWQPLGMRASRSYKMTFENAPIPAGNLVGEAGSYYRQPAFSGGAIRFAAVQLGAAESLLDETRRYLRSLGRTEDPYQRMRLGQMTIAVASGNQWLEGAAEQLDRYMSESTEENSQRFLAFANMMRTAIEQICTDVMGLCQKCVGARGLNKPYPFERIIRDLSMYLRQPAPDAALADVGRHVLETDMPAGELWTKS
jgi:alkylation response protein AidB-like acyl-CoA dehydrogenase